MAETFFDRVHKNDSHTPDVLSCLANLSNDEVFTPPEIVNQMLDMLPQELFSDPNTKFLDPACKTGVFLREIAKRLLIGLEPIYPNLQERIDHIFRDQLYGIAITELTSLLSRRSVYCSKYPNSKYSVTHFNNAEGNIRFKKIQHSWKDKKCIYCGASQEQWERKNELETHAYEFIHVLNPKEKYDMKFDVIIGNPPYQLVDGGSGNGISAKPIYHYFVEAAKQLNPRYITMIIPSRWFAGGKGLDEFRTNMLNDESIQKIVDFPKSRDCFPGVDIAGGVCYFLWNRDHIGTCEVVSHIDNIETQSNRKLNEYPVFVRSNEGVKIIKKIRKKEETTYNLIMEARNPFGFVSSARGSKNKKEIVLISSAGTGYVSSDEVTKNHNLVNKYKVIIGKLNPDRGGVNNASDGKMSVLTKIRILPPNTVCTESYLLLGAFDNIEQAKNCANYFSLPLTRYLVFLALSSMNISRESFQFVPCKDFSIKYTSLV